MKSNKSDACAVIFPNIYDALVPDLVRDRLMASIPFASRYRMIDFMLSSFVNSGVDNIGVVVRKNYYSLLDHLGTGRAWDLARKNGGLNIFPPFAKKNMGVYTGKIEALTSINGFFKGAKEKYVIMADTNIAMNFDFKDLITKHEASGAKVTMVYQSQDFEEAYEPSDDESKGFYYTLVLDGDNVTKIKVNPVLKGKANLCMNIYILEKDFLVEQVKEARNRGGVYFERDVLMPLVGAGLVNAYEFKGYAARITGLRSYFAENMKLLEGDNLDQLFNGKPVYTKVRDDNPTRYIDGAIANNVMVADGCVIEGTVENSILFRGVKVAKGAVVKNCILMQDTIVEEGVVLDHIITDKRVRITAGVSMKGDASYPVYIVKEKVV